MKRYLVDELVEMLAVGLGGCSMFLMFRMAFDRATPLERIELLADAIVGIVGAAYFAWVANTVARWLHSRRLRRRQRWTDNPLTCSFQEAQQKKGGGS